MPYLRELRENPAFRRTFGNFPLSFEEVEIGKVVAAQRTVHLDFVEQLRSRYQHSADALLRFCLGPGQESEPPRIGRTAANAFTFTSENPGLRFLGALEMPYDILEGRTPHPGGQPIHAVAVLRKYSVPVAWRLSQRLDRCAIGNSVRLAAIEPSGFR